MSFRIAATRGFPIVSQSTAKAGKPVLLSSHPARWSGGSRFGQSSRGFSRGNNKQGPDINNQDTQKQTWLQKFLSHKEIPPRGTMGWYREMALLCTVFAITGSSTMLVVRPCMSNILGIKGSLKEGPWSYRICSIVIMTPLYSTLLLVVGTIFGRHFYFRHFAIKMFSRFGIPPQLMDKNFHTTAKNFRKW